MGNWMGFFLSVDREFLFHQIKEGIWHRHLKIPNNHRSYFKRYCTHDNPAPETLQRCTFHELQDKFTVLSASIYGTQDNEVEDILWLGDITITMPKIKWFISHLKTSQSTSSLLEHIIKWTAVIGSVGS